MKGILINTDFDLVIQPKRVNGLIVSGLVIGDTIDQNAALVLTMSQGELKEDPLLGCGLPKFIRSKANASQIETLMRAHLTRAGIDWEDYKERLSYTLKTTE